VKRINRFIARFGYRFFTIPPQVPMGAAKAAEQACGGAEGGLRYRQAWFGPHGKPKGDGVSIVR